MPTNHKLTRAELGDQIEAAMQQFKAGQPVTYSPIKNARDSLGVAPTEFAKFLGMSTRTLASLEQGIKKPGRLVVLLIFIATRHPDAVLEVLAEDAEKRRVNWELRFKRAHALAANHVASESA